jgi:hypothetical protein
MELQHCLGTTGLASVQHRMSIPATRQHRRAQGN